MARRLTIGRTRIEALEVLPAVSDVYLPFVQAACVLKNTYRNRVTLPFPFRTSLEDDEYNGRKRLTSEHPYSVGAGSAQRQAPNPLKELCTEDKFESIPLTQHHWSRRKASTWDRVFVHNSLQPVAGASPPNAARNLRTKPWYTRALFHGSFDMNIPMVEAAVYLCLHEKV